MNEKKAVDNVMHFLIHNSFLFTVVIMCLVHATLLVLSWFAKADTIVLFNVLSVIVYLFCIILCKFGHITPVYVSILLEVGIYAAVSVYYIGWKCCSYCFLFSIVPIVIYFGSFIFKNSKRWIIVLSLGLIFLEYSILYIYYSETAPIYAVNDGLVSVFTIFSAFVMFFSMIFYNTVYIYSSEHEMNTLEKENEQLSVDAKNDILTDMLNRRGFKPKVDEQIKNAAKETFSVAFCDIDNFKRVNDSYGHECGDEVLKHISRMIKKEMSDCDICRWGGEEIVILMKGYDLNKAVDSMENVRKLIETVPTVFYNKHIPVTITIGVVEYDIKFKESDSIIKVADERMYYGKQHGKNIVVFKDTDE